MTSRYTLLSLAEYAKTIGLNPAHFWGGFGGDTLVMPVTQCDAVWPEYPWQNKDTISRESLRREIDTAVSDIADHLGYYPTVHWTTQEIKNFTKFYRRTHTQYGNSNVKGFPKTIKLSHGKFVAPGPRAVSLIDTASEGVELVYSDADADTFEELVTITVTIPAATQNIIDASWYDFSPEQWIRAYYPGEGGALDSMIQEPKSVTISGSTLTMQYNTWQFVDPDLWEWLPTTDKFSAIDLSVTANLLSSVDVYLEYPDYATRSAEIIWNPAHVCDVCDGSGCTKCSYVVQDGCIIARDTHVGSITATPATWDATNEKWLQATLGQARAPDMLRTWYLSGDRSERFLSGRSLSAMREPIKRAISWMVTARLERPLCECGSARTLYDDLSRDLTLSSSEGNFVIASQIVLSNPFGSRKGEVMAWQQVSRMTESVITAGAVI